MRKPATLITYLTEWLVFASIALASMIVCYLLLNLQVKMEVSVREVLFATGVGFVMTLYNFLRDYRKKKAQATLSAAD